MRRAILADLTALFVSLGFLVVVMFVANPHFYLYPQAVKFPAGFVLLGLIGTAMHAGHIFLWRRRPIYNQESLIHIIQIGVLWWTGVLALGLGSEALYYLFDGAQTWRKTAWVGTLLILGAATILIPLCLSLSALGKHLKRMLGDR